MTYPEPGPHHTAVTVYTKPACVQCDQTKRWLDRHNIDYTTVDVTEDPTALDYIKNTLGYSSAPVVTAWPEHLENPIHWAGFQPGKLEQHHRKKRPTMNPNETCPSCQHPIRETGECRCSD